MRHPDRPIRALGWMLVSALSFSTMGALVKALSGRLPEAQIVFARASINFALVAGAMAWRKEPFFSSSRNVLLLRGLFGVVSLCCGFYTLRSLPIGVAVLINWCAPAFVILISVLFLKETLRPATLAWIAP